MQRNRVHRPAVGRLIDTEDRRITMARIFGLVLAGGLVLGAASESKAQFVVGNPYYGGFGYRTGGFGFGAPGFAYSSGFTGFAPVAPGFVGMPAYGGVYRSYGVRPMWGGWGGGGFRRGWGWGGRGWGGRGWGGRGWRRW
jgi:hypothetical protein